MSDPAKTASLLNWWRDMGVDTVIDESLPPWLDRGASPQRRRGPDGSQDPVEAAAFAGATSLPATLVGFQQWLQTGDIPGAGPVSGRLAFSGQSGAALMIVTDMPLAGDLEAGVLLSGEIGALFEKMLQALGGSRETAYLAALCPTRSPAGMIDDAHLPRLGEIARQHIALAAPQHVWLLGDAVSRAVLGMRLMDARGISHEINHEGRTVRAVASFSPAFLHASPKRKGDAWADMQLLLKGDEA